MRNRSHLERWRSRLAGAEERHRIPRFTETKYQQLYFTLTGNCLESSVCRSKVERIDTDWFSGVVQLLLTRNLMRRACSMETDASQQSDEPTRANSQKVLRADELYGESREIWIELDSELYRLRITRRGKLILQN